MRSKLEKILPKYAYIPLILAVVTNSLVYNASKIITNGLTHYDITMKIDTFIPVIPVFAVIYLLCFAEWIVGYILIGRESKEHCFTFVSADIIAKLICLFFFIVIPTTNVRPDLGVGIFNDILAFIYRVDAPVNLFPSIHCLESWIVFRASIKMQKVPTIYKKFTFVFAILTFMSVVFTKQHVFIDIIGGILVVEIGLFIAKRFNVNRIFYKIDKFISK